MKSLKKMKLVPLFGSAQQNALKPRHQTFRWFCGEPETTWVDLLFVSEKWEYD
ncbi:MAG: hypothetical protein QNJ56_00680 [Gammaproteobacteria bacterium]|nr:hypothetical protein [Gammaproteobacteria bacterium]